MSVGTQFIWPTVAGFNGISGSSRSSPGRMWAFLGDSITSSSGASNQIYGFANLATKYVGSFIARTDSYQAGTGGYHASQGLAFLPTLMGMTPRPDAMVVLLGTNDSADTPLASYKASMMAIVARCKLFGIPVVLCTIPPRAASSATATTRQFTRAANIWLQLWGPTQGCAIAETYAALVDSTTGDMLAAYDSGDGKHPNNLGHAKLAQVVAQAMVRATLPHGNFEQVLVNEQSRGLTFTVDATMSLNPNPLMVGAGPMPTAYYEFAGGTGTAPTYSIVNDTTKGKILPAGRWALMDFLATVGGTRRLMWAVRGGFFSVGDVLAFLGIVLVEDVSGTWEADVVAGNSKIQLSLMDGVSGVNDTLFTDHVPGLNMGDLLGTGNTVWMHGPFFAPAVVPGGTVSLQVGHGLILPTGSHIKMYVGCSDYLNASVLGLTDLGTIINMTVVVGP